MRRRRPASACLRVAASKCSLDCESPADPFHALHLADPYCLLTPSPLPPEPNAGRGADLAHYSWTQTLGEVTVCVPVPPGTKGRGLDVAIGKGSLRVGLKGQPPIIDVRGARWALLGGQGTLAAGSRQRGIRLHTQRGGSAPTGRQSARRLTRPACAAVLPLSQGKLSEGVKADDCLWNLADNIVELTLTKAEGMHWWRSVMEGDPPIDTQQVAARQGSALAAGLFFFTAGGPSQPAAVPGQPAAGRRLRRFATGALQ